MRSQEQQERSFKIAITGGALLWLGGFLIGWGLKGMYWC